ncbi:phage head-binding domain-containing protein [Citrobacter youngae]|uniref:phage head-binding domain-containing protein n=1 Tax=Citrobacter youngae TaxID=133448 RepID=UPI00397DE27C
MSDITANIVVSMPSQLFTMPRSFKAVANGKIYISKIDTPPGEMTDPANSVQVYLENENGSHVPVSQPLIINAGGFPVYNGQIAKFVTVEGHAMAVYDSYNAQQFYYPNVLKYDPDRLRQELNSSTDGQGDSLVAVKQPLIGSVPRTQHDKNNDVISIEDFGAIGDGVLHMLSDLFSTLSEAQATYPFVTSLTQSIDYAAIQAALNSGSQVVSSSVSSKKNYILTDTVNMKSSDQVFNLNFSELTMNDSTGLKPHIIVGDNATKINRPVVEKITFINKFVSTVHQIQIKNVGGFVVQDCLSYADNKAYGFIDINIAIVGNIRRNISDSPVSTHVKARGTNPTTSRAVDIAIYDNRFIKGVKVLSWGNYCEGLFFRRNICYEQTGYQVAIEPSSAAEALVSAKIADNDFDSPATTNGCIYIQYYKNVQITGSNWFANKSIDPMIRLENTDSVIISSAQAYPKSTWISDNGVNTTIIGNLVSGGITHVLYGSSADYSSVLSNHMTGASSTCVNANNHTKKLDIIGNHLQATSSAIATSSVALEHNFLNNTGDGLVGQGVSVTLGASPATYKVGQRPEILGFKGGTITSISVNTNQMAVSSNVTIGPLPPHSTVVISYTGATPGMQVLRAF